MGIPSHRIYSVVGAVGFAKNLCILQFTVCSFLYIPWPMSSPDHVNDTIVAQATPVGEGAIGIIRLSGPDSKKILLKIFKRKDPKVSTGSFVRLRRTQDDRRVGNPKVSTGSFPPHYQRTGVPNDSRGTQSDGPVFDSHHLYLGHIINPANDETLDQVLAVWMKPPGSFTGEEMVEIHSHGGPFILCQILNLITEHGARLAEPGEFSKRAYLNGKIDLSQAEAIADLISAKNEFSAKNALMQLNGFFSLTIGRLKEKLIGILAQLESGFDFVEEDIQLFDKNEGLKLLCDIKEKIKDLLDSFQTGQIYKEGLKVALIGKPNVGKSSLLNVLLKDERAIIHHEPGTTRDVVCGERKVHGINTIFYDTAGIRDTDHPVEIEGVKRSEKILDKADLVCLILDSSCEITKEDRILIESTSGKNCIITYNKTDLPPKWDISDLSLRTTSLPESPGCHSEGRMTEESHGKSWKNNNILRGSFVSAQDRLRNPNDVTGLLRPFGARNDVEFVKVSAKEGWGVEELLKRIYDVTVGAKDVSSGSFARLRRAQDKNYVLNNVRHKSALDKVSLKLSEVIGLLKKDKISEECLVEELRIMIKELSGITGEISNEMVLDEVFSKFCIGK